MKTCENCKYSEPIMGGLACMGQKGMPFVRPTDSCDRWKTMKQTNADRIRNMTDEELADYLICDIEAEAVRRTGRMLTSGEIDRAVADCIDWLKQEAEDG